MAKMWIVFIIQLLIPIAWARIGFVKDQSLDSVQFPPIYKKSTSRIVPDGHLRPLGWQRPPEGRVEEESTVLDPREFYEKYVNSSKPVVFRQAIKDVIAMQKWTKDEYLRTKYGSLDVHIVVKKEVAKSGPKVTTFKNFLKEYNFDDWYMTNIIPQEMMEELVLPKCLKCGMTRYLQESGIWMSSGGTASLLHSHADHNLHCLLTGKKDFILIHPRHGENVYYVEREPHQGDGYSEMDMDMINMFKYKEVYDVPWTWATLHPGDCMFVPATYLHQVRSYGRSFSSTILWAPTPEVDFSDCPKDASILDRVTPLNEVSFIWTYLKADRELANIHLNAASLRHHLAVWMRNEPGLRYDVLRDYYEEIMSELQEAEKPSMDEIWQTLAGNTCVRSIPRESVQGLSEDDLTTVAEYLNRPHALHGHEKTPPRHDEF